VTTQKISRRTLISQGGALAAAGIVLAACGSESSGLARVGLSPSTTALPEAHVSDVVLLRTAQSVENLAVAALTDPVMANGNSATKAAIEVFVAGHRANLAAIAPLVAERGGTGFDKPNTRMMQNYVAGAVALIEGSDQQEADVIAFAHALEGVVAATYQAFVSWTSEPALRAAMMSLAVRPSYYAVALAQMVSPGSKGISPGVDEAGNPVVSALPTKYGSLASFEATIGKVTEAGARTVVSMETPSLNSLEY
jgi:hypothetical protein